MNEVRGSMMIIIDDYCYERIPMFSFLVVERKAKQGPPFPVKTAAERLGRYCITP